MARPDKYIGPAGQRLPSVTELLSELGWNKDVLLGWADKMAREGKSPMLERNAAAKRGSQMHALIEWHEGGRPGAPPPDTSLDADLAFEAWTEWRETVALEKLWQEEPLTSDVLGFGGTPDMIALIDGHVTVLDWKTANKPGRPYIEHVIQVTAYAALWNAREVEAWREVAQRPATHGILVKVAKTPDNRWRAVPYSWRLDSFGDVPGWVIRSCLGLRRARELMNKRLVEVF
jgi:hypothetical protein